MVGVALAVAAMPAAAQTYTLKIGNATINDVQHEWQKRWGARVEQRSGGRIKAEIYPASQLGSIPRMIEGLQLGTLEAWIGPPEFLVGEVVLPTLDEVGDELLNSVIRLCLAAGLGGVQVADPDDASCAERQRVRARVLVLGV